MALVAQLPAEAASRRRRPALPPRARPRPGAEAAMVRARSEDEAAEGFAAGAAAHEALDQAPAAADPLQRRPGGKDKARQERQGQALQGRRRGGRLQKQGARDLGGRSEEAIRAFVCSAPGVERDDVVGVRMVNDPATRRFKGICSVNMSSEAKRDDMLSLLRSALEGRTLNVTECQDKDEVAKRRAGSAAEGS
jgi:hypothetical protein